MLADSHWPKVLKRIRNDKHLTKLFLDKVSKLTIELKEESNRLSESKKEGREEKIKKCEIIAKHAISILGTLNFNIIGNHEFTLAVPCLDGGKWTQSKYKVERIVLRKFTGHDGWGFIPTSINSYRDNRPNPSLLVLSGTIPLPAAGIGCGHNVFATIFEDLMLGSSLGAAATRKDRNTYGVANLFGLVNIFGPSQDLNKFIDKHAIGENKEVIAFGQSLGGAGAVSFVQEINRRNDQIDVRNKGTRNKEKRYNISANVVNPPLACTTRFKYFTRACAAVAIAAIVLSITYFSLPLLPSLLIGLGVYSVGFMAYKVTKPKNEWLEAKNINTYRSNIEGRNDWAGLVGDRHIGNLTHIKANKNDGSIVRNHFRCVCRLNLDGIDEKKQLTDIKQNKRYNLSVETIVWLSRAPVFYIFLLVGIIPHTVGSIYRYFKTWSTKENQGQATVLKIGSSMKKEKKHKREKKNVNKVRLIQSTKQQRKQKVKRRRDLKKDFNTKKLSYRKYINKRQI